MTIFDLLKALKRGTFYNVPINPFDQKIKHCLVNHHEAGKHLVEMRNKYQDKYIFDAELEAPQNFPVYIIEKREMQNTPVVKVNVTLKEK